MDVALTLDVLVPAAAYGGSLTANTKAAFDALDWQDERPKPTWPAMQAAAKTMARDELIVAAGAARFVAEVRGIQVGGALVKTDRASQGLINGAFALVQADPGTTIKFKGADGFVNLNATAMRAVALAVGGHVQACFAKEAEVLEGIAAGDITSVAEVEAAFAAV